MHAERTATPYLAWLSMRSGSRITPTAAARRPVKLWSECFDSYDSMKRAAPKSALSSSARRRGSCPPALELLGFESGQGAWSEDTQAGHEVHPSHATQ